MQILQSSLQNSMVCPSCNSPSVINYGKRGKRVVKQIMLYKDCGRQFRKEQEDVFAKLQTDHEIVSLILSMHCRTVSPRGICSVLRETYGIKVSYQTIHNYLKRFEKLLTEYMKSLKPKFSGAVNFSALNPNTSYLLCTVLTQKKDKGAKELFRKLTQDTLHDITKLMKILKQ